ncbi:MAG: SDR family oxidoreductase, partial [Actinobacteria bacterium]|nr:SDR family oxidoreductase [Actinomycetota bacterium]
MSEGSNRAGRLAGKAGVVTGAAAGLGRAVLLEACAEGAAVVAFDRDAEAGEAAVAEVRAAGGTAVFQAGDVSREADCAAAVKRSVAEFGACDILDNNAGVAIELSIEETSEEQIDGILAVNLKGAFFACKHAVRAMREGGGGAIVNTGSIVSVVGDPVLPVYGTTKTGLLGLTRSIAVDYAEDGIRCNAICPGDMLTPMLQRTFDSAPDPAAKRAEMESFYPLKRIADPREA